MANSTALAYRQAQTIDNSGSGAGTQWLHALWQLYQYFFVDAEAVDTGRWRLVDSSPAAGMWTAASNIVDNSWFVVEAQAGRRIWQAKFQASNVAALDESPSSTYSLIVNFSSGAGWVSKGGANGGFTSSPVIDSNNKLLGGLDISGSDGEIIIHGDRDTVLIAISPNGTIAFTAGGYVGRFEPDSSQIIYPECVLVPWDGTGSPKGFDRASAGGCFALTPADSHVLNEASPSPVSEPVQVHCPAWLDSSHQPSAFSGEFTYRPLEISSNSAPLGTLRLVFGVAGLIVKSRLDNRQKIALHAGTADDGVAIKHNGVVL